MREKYLSRLEKHESIIQAINKTAQSVIDPDTNKKLLEIQKNIRDLHKRIKNNSFEIAIVGLEKAGKSTFANALIGLDILPTKEERCTYTSSCVKYAESTYAEVEFFSLQEFKARFESNLKSLGIDFENYEYGRLSLNELQRTTSDIILNPEQRNILEDITDMIRSEAEISLWLGQSVKHFSEAEMLEAEFKNLVQNPDRIEGQYVAKPAFAVKSITVYSNKLEDMKNCIIYDVPGFDSPTAIHMEQTKERMNAADAIIMIANASKPSLTGPQVNVFRSSVDADGVPFNEKIFVFANRADESKNLQYNLGVLRDDLHKYSILRNINNDRLVAGSAYAYLSKQQNNINEYAQQAIDNLSGNGISDGIDEIKQKLEQYNNHVRIKVIEKRVNNIEKAIKEIAEEIKVTCSNITLTSGSNVEVIKTFTGVQDLFKEKLIFYRSDIRNILTDKPLTTGILEALKDGLKAETLFPTESEITYLKKESIQGIAQFESKLRELKRFEVREEFDNITLGISEDLKRGIEDDIIGKLLESLNVSSEHIYFEEIKSMVKEYIENYFTDFNFTIIHKALTLRFSDEVFEILINKPYLMPDRLEYFQNNLENIVSLALYTQNVRDTIKSNNAINTNNLPMINNILFHENVPDTNNNVNITEEEKNIFINTIDDTLKSRINYHDIDTKTLAGISVGWCCDNNVDINSFISILRKTMPDIKSRQYSRQKETEAIKYYLNNTIEHFNNTSIKNTNTTSTVNTVSLEKKYSEVSKTRENTHEWVIESFKNDIRILIDIISGPVVNAIQLEVPFVANITDIIDKIKQDVQERSTVFIEFFGRVYPKSEYKKFEENESIQQLNNEKQAILDNVNELLQELE